MLSGKMSSRQESTKRIQQQLAVDGFTEHFPNTGLGDFLLGDAPPVPGYQDHRHIGMGGVQSLAEIRP
jgi:hypothetical protein